MDFICNSHSTLEQAMFYISIYLIAVGNGAYEPCLVTFGADQFDEEDEDERKSKASFFKYFYVALNLGSMFSETVLAYFQNLGKWEMGFWLSSGCALFSFVMLLTGSSRYRYFKPNGNPLSRFSQVIVASVRKMNYQVPLHGEGLHELQTTVNSRNGRRILHTDDFKWLDRAAIIPHEEIASQSMESTNTHTPNPWYLCTVSQVEEVKCVIRLVPVWLCTVIFSMIFIQMLSLFVEQGAAMNTLISSSFHIPPASMTVFDIICISCFIILYDRFLVPLYTKITGSKPVVLSELQRIGIGLIVAVVAIFSAGLVELQRLKYSSHGANNETSSLSIFWQIPQYILLGVAEAFVYVGELEFFAAQTPDGLKSLGIGLSMASTAIGSYLSSLLLTVVMEVTSKHGHSAGWVPPNLNDGHLHRFFFLSAGITSLNLVAFVVCAKRFKCISFEKRESDDNEPVEEVMA
ncbi:hypothetical protein Scep_006718 [Stephania cephalantha]|uniref:Uncharacterized protein n=1 Tax=Stephania cephalantha TaxID=152367 RepID=A0AAP0K8R0_9MAGN